ncbi:MAG: hypothetical protein IT276_13440 [Ignavibacteriaceae bacterium]|nr:hypothetical protein [Ignavibacterium sp.]MCC6255914.1 hypothetical protein [Ignavibacteriaceae bacterium]HMN24306.1 hypothetical protein [Ignavibacteriaceae bacterium]HRN24931.1 hypothetical protein [Ignavibacteriaceae bacterium]HRP93053.1 hypothetical protein [Ignavibacteriaceae bacterium]
MKRSYKQNLSKLIQNLNKLKAQSLERGKRIPQDMVIAEARLKDYLKVLSWLREKGYCVNIGGEVEKIKDAG